MKEVMKCEECKKTIGIVEGKDVQFDFVRKRVYTCKKCVDGNSCLACSNEVDQDQYFCEDCKTRCGLSEEEIQKRIEKW